MAATALVNEAMAVLGGKWVADVLAQLSDGPLRYSELHAEIEGVASSVLTRTLKRMERDGLLIRAVRPAVPPEVEYSVTPLGKSIEDIITGLAAWAELHIDEVAAARERYAARHR